MKSPAAQNYVKSQRRKQQLNPCLNLSLNLKQMGMNQRAKISCTQWIAWTSFSVLRHSLCISHMVLSQKKNGSLLRPVTKRDAVRRNSPWKNFRPPGKTCWYHRWKIQAIDVKFGPPQKTLRLTRCPKQWRTQKIFMGGFVQCHMVVICIWCALFVTSQFDVIFMFPNQRFGEVC